MSVVNIKIIFYAASLRPGGGLTVAKSIIVALASDSNNTIIVYTGERDSSRELQSTFQQFDNVREIKFFQSSGSMARYLFSKIYFLYKTLFDRKLLLISINYYVPSWCKQIVYHINLLSFMKTPNDTVWKKIKEFDARIACKIATVNVFESDYLLKTATEYVGQVKNPKRLYVGVDDIFFTPPINGKSWDCHRLPNILSVTSPQPHKDNETGIQALATLCKEHPEIPWKLTIVGGQNVSQWDELKGFAEKTGVGPNIEFLGPVSKIDLTRLMQNSLCVISTSLIESFCMVAIESMAAGCPVIVTSETSMPESVDDAAIIVEKYSVDGFYQAILNFKENYDQREKLIKQGGLHVAKFTQTQFESNLENIVNEA
jgi:glycosyltransferase involved in cell wall biosynthesis